MLAYFSFMPETRSLRTHKHLSPGKKGGVTTHQVVAQLRSTAAVSEQCLQLENHVIYLPACRRVYIHLLKTGLAAQSC